MGVEANPGGISFLNFPCTSGDEPYGVAFSVGSVLNLATTSFTFFTFTNRGFVKKLQFGMSLDMNGIPTSPVKEYIADYDGSFDLVGLRDVTMQSSRVQGIVEVRVVPHFFGMSPEALQLVPCTFSTRAGG